MAPDAQIRGWCPGAWRPMSSGDGLVVRVSPRQATLSRGQVLALCKAAETYGNGIVQLTNRANLQLRGVSEQRWRALIDDLLQADLVDADAELEGRCKLLLAPDWQTGDTTDRLSQLLLARIQELPALPAKLGFAIDAGKAPVLTDDSADLRIERGVSGELLVRAEGHAEGTAVHSERGAINLIIRLAHWFVESGGAQAGRMSRHHHPLPPWAPAQTRPAPKRHPIPLGQHAMGAVYGLTFGQVQAADLRTAVEPAHVNGVRVTPWRRILIEGAETRPLPGLLIDNRAPELSSDACPGAPRCDQATVATHPLAGALSHYVEGTLHVSGCSKGCARRQSADVCVVGQGGRYQLIFRGRADGAPDVADLTETQVLSYFGVN